MILSPFPKRQVLDSSKQMEFTVDNFSCDENGRMFSKLVENTVGEGEIARYEQLCLFPKCFQKKVFVLQTRKNQGLFRKGLTYAYWCSKRNVISNKRNTSNVGKK